MFALIVCTSHAALVHVMADMMMRRICITDVDAEESLKQAEEVLKIVQSLSDENLPSKLMYVASLHSCIGNAQLELGDTEEALTHHLEDLRIAEEKLVRGEGRLCGWVGTCL